MVSDGISWLFDSVDAVLKMILSWELPISEGVSINYGIIIIFFYILWKIPQFINLIFGDRKGLVNNGRE